MVPFSRRTKTRADHIVARYRNGPPSIATGRSPYGEADSGKIRSAEWSTGMHLVMRDASQAQHFEGRLLD